MLLYNSMDAMLKKLISDGLTIPQIAEELNKSVSSVGRLLKKFDLKTKRHIDHDPSATSRFCRYCGKEKDIARFPIAAVVKGETYRRHKCNVCYVAMKSDRRQSHAEWLRDYKKTLSCLNCGNDDFRVLEFHHKDDNKEFNVCESVYCSKERIMAEINKCDVLCANCHRIETYESRNGS